MKNINIDGVEITPLRINSDDRGAVLQMMREDSSGFQRFGEVYFSEVLPGAVKAWKRHTRQTQNLVVPVGRVQFVFFDSRTNSPSNGQLSIIELGRPDKYCRVRIPPMVWYGFRCLSDSPSLIANCVDFPHDPSESETRAVGDALFPYSWFKTNN